MNQLKDDFLSTVSHELRTPLSNMNSALHMLQLFLQQPGLFNEQAETLRIKPERAFQYLEVMRSQYQ
ncbi:histidine kinase dimerization/phospho-acceptor domain-containing protein [Trichothermofontia sp.]